MTEASELTVSVRRHPNDWQTAVYRLSDIDGLHRDSVSGGVGRKTSHEGWFGYVMCDGAVGGEVAHTCRHGPAPHRIKICIPKTCNKEDWKAIETVSFSDPSRRPVHLGRQLQQPRSDGRREEDDARYRAQLAVIIDHAARRTSACAPKPLGVAFVVRLARPFSALGEK